MKVQKQRPRNVDCARNEYDDSGRLIAAAQVADLLITVGIATLNSLLGAP